jgi:aspartyl aminopeptidase
LQKDDASPAPFGDNLLRETLHKSWVLSTDTPPAVNPIFDGVWEKGNAIRLGRGPSVLKWGSGRDADPAFFAAVAAAWNEAGLAWQVAPLGRNGAGGGGTIGGFMSQEGMEVLDVGVSVVSMHSPYEVISVEDLYGGYLLFSRFLTLRP